MAEIKFSCPHCNQHISCDEPWAGHQIQCPACQNNIAVPQGQAPITSAAAPAPASESSKPAGMKLSAGATQVTRHSAPTPATTRKFTPRPRKSENSLLKYGLLAVVVAVLAGIGYFYGLPLLNRDSQKEQNGKVPGDTKTSQTSSGGGGPLGEVNGAMDVSDALDGGSSSPRPKPRPAPATNNAARPRLGAPHQ
jgi:hypothetical protein